MMDGIVFNELDRDALNLYNLDKDKINKDELDVNELNLGLKSVKHTSLERWKE
jgi:hypothetical protein